jgi:uncharacterized membrane protein YhaH (DUF805 family)
MSNSGVLENRRPIAWANWRGALKPSGGYDRSHFLFWFFVPIACVIPIVVNMWWLENALIRVSFYLGILKYDVPKLATSISVVLILFLLYLLVVAVLKRCSDLNISRWLFLLFAIPIVGMAFLAFLMLWPGKTFEPGRPTNLSGKIGLSFAVFLVFLVFAIVFPVFQIYLFSVIAAKTGATPLRVWNQTDRVMNVQIATLQHTLIQGYPTTKILPHDLVKYDDVLWRKADYMVKAWNETGEVLVNKTYRAGDMPKVGWTIIIPSIPNNQGQFSNP